MRALGRISRKPCRIYFTGGTSAVLIGWRKSTVDVDLKIEPELDELFREMPEIKERMKINIELAAPSDFIPSLPGWQERSRFIGDEGKISFFHYDPYSQALSKIERRHQQDLLDVKAMFDQGLIEKSKLLSLFREIEPQLIKYPAIDPKSFKKAVLQFVEEVQGSQN